jgi:uncharacterized protein (TIGR03437 family)
MRSVVYSLVLVLATYAARGERPFIAADGVRNAGSWGSAEPGRGALAPGSLAVVFGQNLAAVRTTATAPPFPIELGGVRVLLDGAAAPLLYVSPTQINFQVPSSLLPISGANRRTVQLVVVSPQGQSDPAMVLLRRMAPGIFTQDGSGCGYGAVLNQTEDGSASLNGPEASARPGDVVSVFLTGNGLVFGMPPDGYPASVTEGPRGTVLPTISAEIGLQRRDVYAPYQGKAPGLVGVDQINFQLPPDMPEGCAIAFRLLTYADVAVASSQQIGLSVNKSGGTCVPAPLSLAWFEWERLFLNGEEVSTDRLRLRFDAMEGNDFPVLRYSNGTLDNVAGPRCSLPAPQAIDPGRVTVRTPGGVDREVSINADGSGELSLEPGAIQSGSYSASAEGGADVAPFTVRVDVPERIRLTHMSFLPSRSINCSSGVTVRWTGGSANSLVGLRLVTSTQTLGTVVRATAGEAILRVVVIWSFGGLLPISCPGTGVVEIRHMSDPAAATFSADGLSLGGRHQWAYEYRYTDLPMQYGP